MENDEKFVALWLRCVDEHTLDYQRCSNCSAEIYQWRLLFLLSPSTREKLCLSGLDVVWERGSRELSLIKKNNDSGHAARLETLRHSARLFSPV